MKLSFANPQTVPKWKSLFTPLALLLLYKSSLQGPASPREREEKHCPLKPLSFYPNKDNEREFGHTGTGVSPRTEFEENEKNRMLNCLNSLAPLHQGSDTGVFNPISKPSVILPVSPVPATLGGSGLGTEVTQVRGCEATAWVTAEIHPSSLFSGLKLHF